MRITLLDDGIAYDGASPDSRPLGGAEKAFARLAAALAARGHEVSAINRCAAQTSIDGVAWLPWETPRPPATDVVIAFRKAKLLGEVADAQHRCLWLWESPQSLADDESRVALTRHKPTVVFSGETHSRILKSDEIKSAIIVPGIAEPYRLAESLSPPALVAVTTTHPLHGLQRIVRLWRERVHPSRPTAELHIYSAALRRALDGGQVAANLQSVLDDVRAAAGDGVMVRSPLPDAGMAEAYARARVHLYPVISGEMYATTLAESQAAGCPALIRATGGTTAQLLERVQNGVTGYFAPDDDAFVNLTIGLLDPDGAIYTNLAREARAMQRSRDWADAAIEFEALWP